MTERKVALITGAAGGLGQEIARRLASDGFDIGIAFHTNASGADEVAKQCRDLGARVAVIKADLAEPDQVHGMFATVVEELGRLDVFVHNAAAAHFGKLGAAPPEDYRRAFAVNVDALYIGLGEVAKRMSDGGRVITISSVNVALALYGSSVYSATKAAAETMTRVAARELGKREITCNTIQLGLVDTPSARSVTPEGAFEGVAMQSNVRRVGVPRDVAGMASYLVSDDAGWLTAQTIRLDGGFAG